MSRPKKDVLKDHITATIDPYFSRAIKRYQNDLKNSINGVKPTRSRVIQTALEEFLKRYFETEILNNNISNTDIVESVNDQ
jgi:hypothetical protein